jgi:hypothetical protein
VVHCIQLLLEKPVGLSPAILGYSLLYPWTDNYLDDPRLIQEAKLDFGRWLEQRLRSQGVAALDGHAADVGRLIGLIESSFRRDEFPEVYWSLQAIHRAQMASLAQQMGGRRLSELDLLRTTLRKGGTSVLTDACLVAGALSEQEGQFMFGFGVLLQLMDDLQDRQTDLANGHATLFAQPNGGRLDGMTSKLWFLAQTLLGSCERFEAQKFQPVIALIRENCKLLILQAVARNDRFYSSVYANSLEVYSPFRFAFLKEHEQTLGAEIGKIIATLRRQCRISSALDLLVFPATKAFCTRRAPGVAGGNSVENGND